MAAGKDAALFSARALLAAFPQAPPAASFLSGLPAPADPAEAQRVADPLTRDTFLSALSAAPGLRAVTRLQIALDPITRRVLARGVGAWLAHCAVVPMVALFGGFGTPQLALGVVGMLCASLTPTVILPLFAQFRSTLVLGSREFSAHGASGLARWEQLVGTAGTGGSDSLLLHDPSDDRCPCPAPSCAGSCRWHASALRISEWLVKYGLFCTVFLSYSWTGLTVPGTWLNAWSIALAVTSIVVMLLTAVAQSLSRFSTNVALLEVTDRVRRRAMKLALGDMLATFHTAVESDSVAGLASSASKEPFEVLHDLLIATWARRIRQFNTSSPLLLSLIPYLTFAVANMAAFSCLPAYYIVYTGYVAVLNLFDLVNVAAENRGIDSQRRMYLDAIRELRSLGDRAARAGASPELLRAVDARAALLATFSDVDGYRAKLLGFAVDYGVLRTVAVTALTLFVGLWSILKGLGVFATMQSVCPHKNF
ncbi:hypothetical protein DFJ74DRAFT_192290 [Hyaloraphidium curvatum]|nr:hypothetical protein DFJ74DRAFT_192290 [Hyaloraphidium curvatum]